MAAVWRVRAGADGTPAGIRSQIQDVGVRTVSAVIELGGQRVHQVLPLLGDAQPSFAVAVAKLGLLASQVALLAVVLEAVEVAGNKGSGIPGFDRRKKSGFGTYITREDIEKRGAINTSDLFRTIPGVQVMWNGTGYTVQMTRSSAGYCPVQYYIDGAPFLSTGGDDMDQIVQPQDIQAIEVYKGPTETPAEFQGGGSAACGTIVIWTRRGGSNK